MGKGRNGAVSGKPPSRVKVFVAALRSCRQRTAAIRSVWRLALGQKLVGSGLFRSSPFAGRGTMRSMVEGALDVPRILE